MISHQGGNVPVFNAIGKFAKKKLNIMLNSKEFLIAFLLAGATYAFVIIAYVSPLR
ncbi:hypothetical protein [Endozoicomonas sp. ONNA2]|uniref:hypothetical protein n=1 Tax=Endozoicomonas sp. ONNA2 TaxID=2828741 RepID=UPI002148862E|nr:hypothetical protein [Endozoicomonas sp. ONNA2]